MVLSTIKKEKTSIPSLKKKLVIYLTPKEFELIKEFSKKDYLTIGRYGRKILLSHCAEMSKLEKSNEIQNTQ